jgi:hypothetical protein
METRNPNEYTDITKIPRFTRKGLVYNSLFFKLKHDDANIEDIGLSDGINAIYNVFSAKPPHSLDILACLLDSEKNALDAIAYWAQRGYNDGSMSGVVLQLEVLQENTSEIYKRLSSASSSNGE